MKTDNVTARIAVVGCGPRGLGALEALMTLAVARGATLRLDIFDPVTSLGAGPNYDPDQSDSCILNIPVRMLDLPPPAFLQDRIAPFQDWTPAPYDPEDFPPRSAVGAYLNARFDALRQATHTFATLQHHPVGASDLEKRGAGWWLMAAGTEYGPYDEVLLTQGQPETALDPQLQNWQDHAKQHDLALLPAYPANTVIDAAAGWRDKTVAIRGLGLSTFDVLRMLTRDLGGTFDGQTYTPSGNEPHKILPFSLNGLPPAPKPADQAIDQRFDPTEAETKRFLEALETALTPTSPDPLETLCDAVQAPAVRILRALGSKSTQADVQLWLAYERDHAGAQEYLGPLDTLESGIEMSYGRIPPSVGYTVSQLWRKWEGHTRSFFNNADLGVETADAIVAFDESLKRYSAGPPVTSCEELRALIQCGIVSLCTVDDPAVICTPNGWQLLDGDDALTAAVMIDAVLPTPDARAVCDPLIVSALEKGLMQCRPQGGGLVAAFDGQLLGSGGTVQNGLSALGRMSLGNVIAVDSLHDCFGDMTGAWATGVFERLSRATA